MNPKWTKNDAQNDPDTYTLRGSECVCVLVVSMNIFWPIWGRFWLHFRLHFGTILGQFFVSFFDIVWKATSNTILACFGLHFERFFDPFLTSSATNFVKVQNSKCTVKTNGFSIFLMSRRSQDGFKN